MTANNFAALGLAEPLLHALDKLGLETPTPIQSRAIPVLLEGADLIAVAQTGTGKTAAFMLPILHHLSGFRAERKPRRVGALVLAPTRELAVQIHQAARDLGRSLRLNHALVLGGVNRGAQIRALSHGVDVLIATPGRLLDLIQDKKVDLRETGYLVLDEADRMLDMGFVRDVRKIVAQLPGERQSLLFSATMPREVEKLARDLLHDPERIDVTPKQVSADRIAQSVVFADGGRKRAILAHLLKQPEFGRSIVFTRTKHGANRVSQQLERAGIRAEAIHGNKSQGARQRALEAFKTGRVGVLVATDIAARGVHIDSVTHVINFDIPVEAESYVHRIGRTARAGASGTAISLCSPAERSQLRAIERLTKSRIDIHDLDVAGLSKGESAGTATEAEGPVRPDSRQRNDKPGSRSGPRRRRTGASGKQQGHGHKRMATPANAASPVRYGADNDAGGGDAGGRGNNKHQGATKSPADRDRPGKSGPRRRRRRSRQPTAA